MRFIVVNEFYVLGVVKNPETIHFWPFNFCDFLSIGELAGGQVAGG